jgi:hypothetical protein
MKVSYFTQFCSIFSRVVLTSTLLYFLCFPPVSHAVETAKLGMHVLSTTELIETSEFLALEQPDQWHYLTIPFTLEDLAQEDKWREFFAIAKERKVIPLVRLVTEIEDDAWKIPTRKNIVDQLEFLARFEWPTPEKHIIVFNEVNHAKEWGNTIDPAGYADVFAFTSQWAHSHQEDFVVLPAALDLAAPNSRSTTEAFKYLSAMQSADPDVFLYADFWNSHSYPNPGFSSSPQRTGQNSLRGFEHELAFLKRETGRDFQVFITETGWEDSAATNRWLSSYYTYALQHIWSHPQVIAVTPFVYRGAPGPFAGFSFISASGEPTTQYHALLQALKTTQIPQISQVR